MKEKKKKVYIGGKMTGLTEEESKALFARAEELLKAQGYEVVNPWKIEVPKHYSGQLLRSLEELAKCDAIYLLDNWTSSNGANCEYWFAKGMGIDIMFDGVFDPNDFAFCLQPIDEYVVDFGDRECHFRLIKETNFRDE